MENNFHPVTVLPALWIEGSSRSMFLVQDGVLHDYNENKNLPFLKNIKNAMRGKCFTILFILMFTAGL